MPVLAMPKLGLTMEEGKIAEWKVRPGDAFAAGDVLVVIETDKIASEIEAPADGVMVALDAAVDDVLPVGSPLARWASKGEAIDAAVDASPKAQAIATVERPQSRPVSAAPAPRDAARIIATPLARREASRLSVDLGKVAGSGPRGRVKLQDVLAAAEKPAAVAPRPQAVPSLQASDAVKATRWQAVAAERMVLSKTTIPHFYLSSNVDAAPLEDAVRHLRGSAPDRRITATHLILLAMGRALRQMPEANRVWSDGSLVNLKEAAVGLAVATSNGLAAPIVPRCDGGVWEIAARTNDVVERARQADLTVEDMQHPAATTLSNAGMFNIAQMISIIPPGQSSILGIGSTQSVFRPDEVGAPRLCREFTMSLSCDHRVFDGVSGIRFLNLVRDALEAPLKAILAPV